jgi:selenium-binding protein 1
MLRREFLKAAAAGCAGWKSFVSAALAPEVAASQPCVTGEGHLLCCGPTYATPQDAMRSARETLAFVPVIYTGTGRKRPDCLATVDLDPDSKTYGKVSHRLEMPYVGDELHHYSWSMCSSCHGKPGAARRYLVVPGLESSNVHIIDAADPRRTKLHKVIRGEELAARVNLSGPHTVHCGPDGNIIVSMLGDARGNGPGGFVVLDQEFEVVGRWDKSTEGMHANYDFWYQPRHNVMVSSEWAAPTVIRQGFKGEDVEAGKYGQRLHFWDWTGRRVVQTVDMADQGRVPLEVRFHHNPSSTHGFVGAALSTAVWHWHKAGNKWEASKVIQVEPVKVEGQDAPLPGLMTDIVLSMDDRFLYLSNWLHGDVRQYDVSDPAKPKLTGQVWLGGKLGKGRDVRGRRSFAGPQMLQLSLDGKRLYLTDSLYSAWDNQFYPDLAKKGSLMVQLDCDTKAGGMELNERFLVDFGAEPGGPARAHEIRFPGGDCTSDIWV